MERFNERFTGRAAKPENLHRQMNVAPSRLSDILCHREQRYVGAQLSFHYDRKQIILERSEVSERESPRRPSLSGRSHGIYQLSEIREALFDTTAVFFVKSGAANATPHLRGLYLASVTRCAQLIATWCGAEELASRAMLFLETPCERRPAIASTDVGQRARSRSSIRP